MKKKITWEYLWKYCYDNNVTKDKDKESIIFRHDDKYFLGFAKHGSVKLFPAPDWWQNFIIISKKMSYEEMFFIMKQLKELTTPKTTLEKTVENKND